MRCHLHYFYYMLALRVEREGKEMKTQETIKIEFQNHIKTCSQCMKACENDRPLNKACKIGKKLWYQFENSLYM